MNRKLYLSMLLVPLFLSVLTPGCKAGAPVLRIEAAEANRSPILLGVAFVFMSSRTQAERTMPLSLPAWMSPAQSLSCTISETGKW